jgi:unsaturated rhamnogalacturonyl hydrolase
MTELPDKTSLAATAEKIFHFMTLEHSGYSDQMSAAVDANPASWGLNINDWEWNPGVGVTAISDYYDASQKPEVLEFWCSGCTRTATWPRSTSTSTR